MPIALVTVTNPEEESTKHAFDDPREKEISPSLDVVATTVVVSPN